MRIRPYAPTKCCRQHATIIDQQQRERQQAPYRQHEKNRQREAMAPVEVQRLGVARRRRFESQRTAHDEVCASRNRSPTVRAQLAIRGVFVGADARPAGKPRAQVVEQNRLDAVERHSLWVHSRRAARLAAVKRIEAAHRRRTTRVEVRHP